MGIRTRFKDLVRAQVRERLSRFDVRSNAPGPEPGAGAGAGPAKVTRPSPPNADSPARTVVRAPVLPTETTEVSSEGEGLRIRAQPSRDGQTCTFGLDRSLLSGQSWWFGDTDAATASPLASALFAQVDAIESVVVDEATLSVTVTSEHTDWTAVAPGIGALLRAHLEGGEGVLPADQLSSIPSEDILSDQVQKVIDETINPGVAAHSGVITLSRVRGNAVYIHMGGGCQGCSAAAVTLKSGIFTSLRDAIPGLGAIYDDTDHAAGVNPYYR